MAGVKVASKIKFSVYLREKAVEILLLLKTDEERQTSASIAKAIRTHKAINFISPATVSSAQQILKNVLLSEDPLENRQKLPRKRNYKQRVQTYLSDEEADYLKNFGRKYTNGNYSLAINQIIEEVAAIASVSPSLFTQYCEATK